MFLILLGSAGFALYCIVLNNNTILNFVDSQSHIVRDVASQNYKININAVDLIFILCHRAPKKEGQVVD